MAKEKIVLEIEPRKYITELAAELKKNPEFKLPEWAVFVKTSMSRSRPPLETDWWWMRSASILRQIYANKVVGVQRLRTRYGSRKKRGMKPEKFFKAGGKIIRTILQQAGKAGLIEEAKDGKRKGRKLTKQGREMLESIAKKLK